MVRRHHALKESRLTFQPCPFQLMTNLVYAACDLFESALCLEARHARVASLNKRGETGCLRDLEIEHCVRCGAGIAAKLPLP
jgi:hypothetical protein